MWIAVSSVVFLLLVYIGIRQLLPPWHNIRRSRKTLKELGQWLQEQTEAAKEFAYYTSDKLPPEVYDGIAKILERRPELEVRILTEKKVLCKKSGGDKQNNLVELYRSKKLPNMKLGILDKLPENHYKLFDRIAWVEIPHPKRDTNDYREGFIIEGPMNSSVYMTDFKRHWKKAIMEAPGYEEPERIFGVFPSR